jgi:WD40 repeat protein
MRPRSPANAASALSAGVVDAGRSEWIWATEGEKPATSAAIAPNGQWVAIGMAGGRLLIYAIPEGRVLADLPDAHKGDVNRIAISPDGRWLATASDDKTAKLWSISATAAGNLGLTRSHTLFGYTRSVMALTFSSDGRRMATASYDGQIGQFDVATGKGRSVKAHEGRTTSVAFDTTGEWLLSSGDDYKLRLWRANYLEQPPRELVRLQDTPTWASIAPDGRSAAVVGRELTVILLDLTRPNAGAQRLVGHENTVHRAIHSPDGRQLATVSMDMTLRLWDLGSQRLLFTQRLPTLWKDGQNSPLWDFDFRCIPETGECWAVVPLTMGRVVAYRWPYEQLPKEWLAEPGR